MKGNPMAAHAELQWTQGLQFVARADQAPAVVMDNPEGGSAPTPMQLVLMGTAGCTAMDVVTILRKKRAAFSGVQINVSTERAEEHPRRYTKIDLEFVITGRGIKEKDVAQAIELSLTKYCSATASLNADVTSRFRIVETS
jgi:putative redox protein